MATKSTTEASVSNSDRVDEVGIKAVTVKLKTDGLAEGEFTGYASVFGNKDSYGDIVVKGAFANTLAEWERKGLPLSVLWGHNTSDPDYNIGEVITIAEDDHGLKFHAKFDMESPKAAQSYRLVKSGRVNQMSFAYRVIDGAYVQPEGEGKTYADAFYELRELELYEISVVPIGANQETEILAVKSVIGSLAAKAGRTLSAKNEDALRGALSQAEEIVTALKGVLPADDSAADEGKDQDQTSGKEPPAADVKSAVMATPSPSVYLALLDLATNY